MKDVGGMGWVDAMIFVAAATQLYMISMQRLAQQTNATPDFYIVDLS